MIELRRAVPEDLDCLFEAANSAFAGSTVSGKGPRWKRSREFLGDCLAEQECWCILLDGRTVGGLLLFPQPDCLWLEGAAPRRAGDFFARYAAVCARLRGEDGRASAVPRRPAPRPAARTASRPAPQRRTPPFAAPEPQRPPMRPHRREEYDPDEV